MNGENMARQCFYQGQSVAPEHLNKLQDFSMQGQASLISSLLGYGIVNGFEIETIEGHIVGVSAGLAFNLQGERLVLSEGKQVNLIEHKPNTGEKTIRLGMVLDYVKTEPTTDSMGNTVYTKWTPSVQFIIADSSVGFGEEIRSAFELADIKLSPTSITEINPTAPNFGTLPNVEEKLLQQIQTLSDKTSALTTGEDGVTLSNPLINLITQNLQINGTPYMEIGSNENGHYVKFENGLLIIWGGTGISQGVNHVELHQTFPCQFIEKPKFIQMYYSNLSLGDDNEENFYNHDDVFNFVDSRRITNISFVASFSLKDVYRNFTPRYLAIGFWK